MSVDYLRMYQAKMARDAARSILEDPEQDEQDFPEISFPPVIIVSGGALFSGRVAGPDGYNARLRRLLRHAPDSDPDILQGLLTMFPGQSVLTQEQLLNDELPHFEHLYLIDVRSYQGHRVINLPALTIRFDAVDGWTLGELPQ